MTGRVTVVIPWADSGDHQRKTALDHVLGRWKALARADTTRDWQVFLSTSTSARPWVKARTVGAGAGCAAMAGGLLVVADADVWTDGILPALDAIDAGAAWAVPHLLVHRLTAEATLAALQSGVLGGPTHRRPYGGVAGGGIVILRAADYDTVPLDPRFVGWGQEDQAWGTALTAVLGLPWRGTADLWHLWHEPQTKMSTSRGSRDGWTLVSRYWRAAKDPAAIRGILAEIGASTTPEPVTEGTRRMPTWTYRNLNTGQLVESPVRRDRLERLPNWETVSEPGERPVTVEHPGLALTAEATTQVEVIAQAEAQHPGDTGVAAAVRMSATGTVTPLLDLPGPEAVEVPKQSAPKQDWVTAAVELGVPDPDSLTKAQLVEQVRIRARCTR